MREKMCSVDKARFSSQNHQINAQKCHNTIIFIKTHRIEYSWIKKMIFLSEFQSKQKIFRHTFFFIFVFEKVRHIYYFFFHSSPHTHFIHFGLYTRRREDFFMLRKKIFDAQLLWMHSTLFLCYQNFRNFFYTFK